MSNVEWIRKQYLWAWIFNVGRGNCAFVITPSRDGVLIDCGGDENIIASIKKRLLPFCREHKWGQDKVTRIGQIIVSHPHIDHFGQIKEAKKLYPYLWTCPHDKVPKPLDVDERINWELIKNPEGSEEIIEEYRNAYEGRNLPLQVFRPTNVVPYFSYGIFYIRPPDCEPIESQIGSEKEGLPERDYGNNISVMVYFMFSKSSIFFPGDMMCSGMKRAIETGCENRLVGEGIPFQFATQSARADTLRNWINTGCSVLVAPHHGLVSGYSNEFFSSLPVADPRVDFVVISEKAEPRKDEGKVHNNYQNSEKVKGLQVIGQNGSKKMRLSVTTRTDGHCLVGFRGNNEVSVVTSQDLEWILTKGPCQLFT
ncbi:MAG: MBL fold metallo-hydrolase [Sedimentisphaerales bacterium]|nr:MBL fold metallo-hydrolase [Sedimentisphaerales bacterium]